MSQIKGKNTKPEILVRRYLFHNGFRFRIHYRNLPGRPDIVLPKFKTVIFVHGCFWHGHENCKYFKPPKTRTDWWLKKIEGNKTADKRNKKAIEDSGWKVIIIYECKLKSKEKEKTLNDLKTNIH